MTLRSKLLTYTAALALTAGAAYAAIDGTQLANGYLAQGYTFVEVKVGPTQTKVEAIKNGRQVEVVYNNATGAIIKQEEEAADADDVGRTGTQVRSVNRDFEDGDDDDDDHGRGHDDDDDDDDDRGRGGNDDPGGDRGSSGHGSDHDDDDDDDDDDDN